MASDVYLVHLKTRYLAALCATILVSVFLNVGAPVAWAQAPDTALVNTPIPETDTSALIKELGLIESRLPVRDMIKGWHRPEKIVVFPDNNTNRITWLQEVARGVKLIAVHNREEAIKELADADAQVGTYCNRELIASAGPNFHWMHDMHTGMEACFGDNMLDKLKTGGSIVVTNTQRVFGDAVAVHATALMLALARGLDLYARMDSTGHLTSVPLQRLWELEGRTLLIAGFGSVGSEMARLGHDLGMHVIATNRTIPTNLPSYVEHVGLPNELGDMIGKADVVMVALPLTPETTNLFNADIFAKMKHGAMFINVARGAEVVNADLVAALKSGQVGYFGADVTEPANLPADDPLFTAPNVLITRHMAAQAIDSSIATGGENSWAIARENLRRYVAGDKLLSVVDPERGY